MNTFNEPANGLYNNVYNIVYYAGVPVTSGLVESLVENYLKKKP
jgi:hypothetical protein